MKSLFKKSTDSISVASVPMRYQYSFAVMFVYFTISSAFASSAIGTIITDPTGQYNYVPAGINDNAQVVGWYGGSFVASFEYSNGIYKTINNPNGQTSASGINNNGQIVGAFYTNEFNNAYGFVYSNGVYTTLSGPNDNYNGGFTIANGINNLGEVVGNYLNSELQRYGFIYSNGVYTTINDPNASVDSHTGLITEATGINDSGQIVGTYSDVNGASHGFEYSNGVYTTIDHPSTVFSYSYGTQLTGINNNGQIVGFFTGSDGREYGFEYTNGVFKTLSYPNPFDEQAGPGDGTFIQGINNNGQLIGYYATHNNIVSFITSADSIISSGPPVPVPAAIWLFASALSGLLCITRRSKKAN